MMDEDMKFDDFIRSNVEDFENSFLFGHKEELAKIRKELEGLNLGQMKEVLDRRYSLSLHYLYESALELEEYEICAVTRDILLSRGVVLK
jgi:hypothetical protein